MNGNEKVPKEGPFYFFYECVVYNYCFYCLLLLYLCFPKKITFLCQLLLNMYIA